jgi:osmotically-inducible protein OsmY
MHVPDDELEKLIHDRLQRCGVSPDQIRAIVDQGKVKLVGTLQFETQRRGILKAITAIEGVQRVDDQMLVETKKRR